MIDSDIKQLNKILYYAKRAFGFVENIDKDKFKSNEDTQWLSVFALIQLGECVTNLSEHTIKEYSQIPWRKMKGFRNQIVHAYDGLDMNLVWDTLNDDMPNLIESISNVLSSLEQ